MVVKITELTALTSPDAADILPIVDNSASETKKITVANFLGQWGTWTPNLTGGDCDLSGYDIARYCTSGDTVHFVFVALNRSASGSAGTMIITLPVAPAQSLVFPFQYHLYYTGQSSPGYPLCMSEITASSTNLILYKDTVGSTFAATETGIYIRMNGSYEI